MRRLRLFASVLAAVITMFATVLVASPASAKDPISYTFRFVNGQTISGIAQDKTHFLADAGGTSADNPTGMTVHLSCSDKFSGGWGEKDGPEQGVDTAWQIDSYFIQKGSKTCGTPTPPPPPADPPAIDIEKFVNGLDADDPTGPEINIGETAVFTYEVTNTGGINVRDIAVEDSELGAIGCPRTELDPGESMFCDEQSEVVTTAGQFTMKATVTGIGDVSTPGLPVGSVSKGDAYRFTFVNGITIANVGKKNDFFANAGGSSVTNPTGMKVHLSCSDRFIGGWGQKDGPVQGVDTAWQIDSYSIGKLKDGQFELKCGDPFVTTTEVPVMDMDPVYFIVPPPADPKIDIEKFVNGDDADNPPGPTLDDGSTATFTYVVTNTGDVPLEDVSVNDNIMGAISCPRTELGVGESMECTPTEMVVEVGNSQFMEACAKGSNAGREVDDCDPVYYTVPPPDVPKIDIEKFVNGQDADTPPGPTIQAGDFARFVYVVVNNGDVPLENISVVDNVMGALTCPRTELDVGESMVCNPTIMRVDVGDSQFMEACVDGFNAGRLVSDCDPVYYTVPPPPGDPKIDIEKFVNGDDADNPPGPTLVDGSTARFTYIVTNTGALPLNEIVVTDNVVGAISCPRTELGVGESMNCSPTEMVVEVGNSQFMESCVMGSNDGRQVEDCDPVYYTVPPPPTEPKIDIEKFVEGQDADNPPGPSFESGRDVEFTYLVTNVGDVPLSNISVVDNVVGAIACPRSGLGVGESMNCSPTTMAVEFGSNFMESCVTGSNAGTEVADCDPVYFKGVKKDRPTKIGDAVTFDDGSPAAGVKVNLYESLANGRRGRFLGKAATNANGIYGFDAEAECYVVVFIAPDGYQFVGGNQFLEKRTCLDPGEVDNTVDAVLRKG